jgi:hypothetical protein
VTVAAADGEGVPVPVGDVVLNEEPVPVEEGVVVLEDVGELEGVEDGELVARGVFEPVGVAKGVLDTVVLNDGVAVVDFVTGGLEEADDDDVPEGVGVEVGELGSVMEGVLVGL